MALKLPTKKKPVVEVVAAPVVEPVMQTVLVVPPQTEIEALTAEYVDLYKKYEYFEVKALVQRMEAIRKQLVAVANETMDPEDPAVFTSPQGKVFFSERGKKATIPNPLQLVQDLLEKLGPEATASVVDIAITPLRKLLSESELKSHLVDVPGGRTLKGVLPMK